MTLVVNNLTKCFKFRKIKKAGNPTFKNQLVYCPAGPLTETTLLLSMD